MELLPDLRSDDRRLGFQALEPLVINMLYAGLAYYAVFFTTRVHFLFAAQHVYPDVYGYVSNEVLLGLVADIKAIATGRAADVLAIGPLQEMSPMVSALALFALLLLAVLVPILVLRQAAQRASARHRAFLDEGSARVVGVGRPSVEEQRAKLGAMRVWPLEYPREVMLIAFVAATAAAFVFYRLTFVLVAALLAQAVVAVHRLVRKVGEPPPAPPRAG